MPRKSPKPRYKCWLCQKPKWKCLESGECKEVMARIEEAHKAHGPSLEEYLATESQRRQPPRKVVVS